MFCRIHYVILERIIIVMIKIFSGVKLVEFMLPVTWNKQHHKLVLSWTEARFLYWSIKTSIIRTFASLSASAASQQQQQLVQGPQYNYIRMMVRQVTRSGVKNRRCQLADQVYYIHVLYIGPAPTIAAVKIVNPAEINHCCNVQYSICLAVGIPLLCPYHGRPWMRVSMSDAVAVPGGESNRPLHACNVIVVIMS